MTEEAGLPALLRAAPTVAAACSVVVDHLVDSGLPLPSLYLERGGRLRCQAVRGYWQVFDGMPVGAGVIGSTFRTGKATEIRGVSGSADYLAAFPTVVDEVCVPIRVAGRVVGALNVESTTGLPPDALALTTSAASAFAKRLAELGGVPTESPAQRLARHAATIAEVSEVDALWEAACAAAREVTGNSSAAVVLADGGGDYEVACAAGRVTESLAAAVTPATLAAIAGWVASGCSCWTLDDPDGTGFSGSESLRDAGAGGALVISLGAARTDDRHGFLLVADERSRGQATDVVELLELLGTHVTSCARTLASLAALRRQANRDPLTDLGHHAAYQTALADALDERALGAAVVVVLLDIDEFKSVNDRFGHPAGDDLLRRCASVLTVVLREGEELYRVGGDEFATVLWVEGEDEAMAVAERLRAAARARLGATISVGVAVARSGEDAAAVIGRADAALYAVKRTGRDGVRSAATQPGRRAAS